MILNLAKKYREGAKPLAEASDAVKKEVVSGMPLDPTARKPTPKDDDKSAS